MEGKAIMFKKLQFIWGKKKMLEKELRKLESLIRNADVEFMTLSNPQLAKLFLSIQQKYHPEWDIVEEDYGGHHVPQPEEKKIPVLKESNLILSIRDLLNETSRENPDGAVETCRQLKEELRHWFDGSKK